MNFVELEIVSLYSCKHTTKKGTLYNLASLYFIMISYWCVFRISIPNNSK